MGFLEAHLLKIERLKKGEEGGHTVGQKEWGRQEGKGEKTEVGFLNIRKKPTVSYSLQTDNVVFMLKEMIRIKCKYAVKIHKWIWT